MNKAFARTELLLGQDGMKRLATRCVAVFGVGGVGSFTCEALVRSGLARILLIDYDIIDITNINRQLHATSNTIGKYKVDVMKDRLLEINPSLEIQVYREKYDENNKDFLGWDSIDYIVDAIDNISAKIDLIVSAKERNIPIISSMGAGNKLNPTDLMVSDLYQTSTCPLARVMRRELRKRQVDKLRVVWSKEIPIKCNLEKPELRKAVPGSVGFVPSVAGLIIASEVVKDIVFKEV